MQSVPTGSHSARRRPCRAGRRQNGQIVDAGKYAPEVIAVLELPLPGGRPGETDPGVIS